MNNEDNMKTDEMDETDTVAHENTVKRIYRKGFKKAVFEIYRRLPANRKPDLIAILQDIMPNVPLARFPRYHDDNPESSTKFFSHCETGFCHDGAGGCVECPETWRD